MKSCVIFSRGQSKKVTVTVVTVLTDLAIAVTPRMLIAALVFAWKHAKHMVKANMHEDPQYHVADNKLD